MTVAEITERKPRGKIANDAPTQTLWEALAQAQEQFGPILKDTQGARGKYAPLDAVLDMARPILNANSIILTQPTTIEGDTLIVRTVLVHKTTGETHECAYPAGALSLAHQQLGAGVTYARRYSLLSLLGVFPENEDDDGEKAGAAGGARTPPQSPPRQQAKVLNPDTGRMVDPSSPNQQRKNGTWDRYCERVRSFTDIDELESWWADADTQAKIEQMPEHWQKLAAEEYEKAQERLLNAGRP